MPVDPSFAVSGWIGPEFSVGSVESPGTGGPGSGQASFGGALSDALAGLQKAQEEAAIGAQQLAAGTAEDPASVVMAVERARLSMQLASQIRTKAVESVQELFHSQV